MTDLQNAEQTVAELCTLLDSADSVMKEDMVVKIALLAEMHATSATNLQW